jgi:uncharacterized protein involved in cysteine biosynthesis
VARQALLDTPKPRPLGIDKKLKEVFILLIGWRSYGTDTFREFIATGLSMLGSLSITVGCFILAAFGLDSAYFITNGFLRWIVFILSVIIAIVVYLILQFILSIITAFIAGENI